MQSALQFINQGFMDPAWHCVQEHCVQEHCDTSTYFGGVMLRNKNLELGFHLILIGYPDSLERVQVASAANQTIQAYGTDSDEDMLLVRLACTAHLIAKLIQTDEMLYALERVTAGQRGRVTNHRNSYDGPTAAPKSSDVLRRETEKG